MPLILIMKRTISILLAVLVLCGSLPRIDRYGIVSIEEERAQGGLALVLFYIGCAVGAGYGIYRIWVALRPPAPGGTYYWALEESSDHVHWTAVATNALRMTDERAWDAFEVYRDANTAVFWRMRQVEFIDPSKTNTLINPNLTIGSIDPNVKLVLQP